MERKKDETERFDLYLKKTFNKTASLIAHTCKANAIIAAPNDCNLANAAFEYGKHVGIAFQVVDDILDFESKQVG